VSAPGILRRLAALIYESTLLFGVAFVSTALFLLASGGASGLEGWRHLALQVYLGAVFAGYFLWCWLRGGQTLAMKAWHIRLVAPGRARVPPGKALLRFVLAALLVPTGIGVLWALFDPERQFLHDRLAGTRLVSVPR
jgi:uncharacterized RDD family membrane protein YckC